MKLRYLRTKDKVIDQWTEILKNIMEKCESKKKKVFGQNNSLMVSKRLVNATDGSIRKSGV